MDRREFIQMSAAGLACIGLGLDSLPAFARRKATRGSRSYSIIILGDTHYDKGPDEIYHDGYSDPSPSREANHRKEFVRNYDMWEERCPRLISRASALVDKDTKMVFQTGDLIQGDTAGVENHIHMLSDAFNLIKGHFGPLPLVTCAGNHDVRAKSDRQAREAYEQFMPARISKEIGKAITRTTFSFTIGRDAFIVIDFNAPEDDLIDSLLEETEGARYTFVLIHAPILPYDSESNYDWILHGKDGNDKARRHFREALAKRNAIVLCGHVHTTEFADWEGDGGRITQMTMNSVFKSEGLACYDIKAEGPKEYGILRERSLQKAGKKDTERAKAFFEEYRPGLRVYSRSSSAGSYKMKVSDGGVTIDFYAGDSMELTQTFHLR